MLNSKAVLEGKSSNSTFGQAFHQGKSVKFIAVK